MANKVDVVVLTGQSNAIEFGEPGFKVTETISGTSYTASLFQLACIQAGINLGLGPTGVRAVFQQGEAGTSDGTAVFNTALLPGSVISDNPTWFDFTNGNAADGITTGTLEQAMNRYLVGQYGSLMASGVSVNRVAVIDMQNETDEGNAAIGTNSATLTDWEQAVVARRDDIAGDFGQTGSSTPLSFVWVPSNASVRGGAAQAAETGNYSNSQSGLQDQVGQARSRYALHAAEQALVDNPADNMSFVGNFGDVSMSGDGRGDDTQVNGNQHFSVPVYGRGPNDFQPGGTQADFITRVANSISNQLAADAQPASAVALAGGTLDTGPVAQSATLLADGTGVHVMVTFSLASNALTGSIGLGTLGNFASLGAGWTVGQTLDYGAAVPDYAIAAQRIDASSIELTFAAPISPGQPLYYEGIGDGQITFIDYWDHANDFAENPGYSKWNGEGAAIYDSQGLPIQVTATGLTIQSPPPTTANPVVLSDTASAVQIAATGTGSPRITTVIGGAGDDTVSASDGRVLAFGGSGRLTFYNGSAASTVVGGGGGITGFTGTGGGVLYGAAAGGNTLVAGAGAATLVGAGAGDRLFANGAGGSVLIAGSGNQTLVGGTSGTNVMFGGSGADVIAAGAGADFIVAGSGSTTIEGGSSGGTVIFAGAGAAVVSLTGGGNFVQVGSGAATVSAGTGSNQFAATSGAAGGTVEIDGFDASLDRIALRGYSTAMMTSQNGSTVIALSDQTTILLAGVTGLDRSIFN